MRSLRSSILVVLLLTACAHRAPAPAPVEGGYRFACPARGGKVYLVGDFNQWRRERMKKTGGWAELVVKLKPGAYAYACAYADGRIESPPEAPGYVDDGFGSRNGFLVVPKVTRADAAASNR